MRNSLRVTRFVVAMVALLAGLDTAKGEGFDLNHYILGCGDYCPSIINPVALGSNDIDATYTGAWYDPDQSGQGLFLEILPDHRAIAFWFTFNPAGTQQVWLVGNGTYSGNVATINSVDLPTGGRWIPNFDPRQVVNNPWGTLTLTFYDAGDGRLDYASIAGYGSGSMRLARLTRPAGITATALSASGKAWVPTGNLQTPRTANTSTLLADGKVLVAGGLYYIGDGAILGSAELYDPATGSWTLTGSMAGPRAGHAAIALPDGRVLVVGGEAPNGSDFYALVTAELYDPATGSWTPTGSLQMQRIGFTATLLHTGKVLVAGGDDSVPEHPTAELYDPASGRWTFTGSPSSPSPARGRSTASVLSDGRVLVTGGTGPSIDFSASTELYDPVTGAWSTAASLHVGRLGHTETVLKDGNVLVAGGYVLTADSGADLGYDLTPISDAEIYDISADGWRDVAGLMVPRGDHSATLLPDGTVLVAGGFGPFGILANAEIFDPLTENWSSGGSFDDGLFAETATLLQNGNVLIGDGLAVSDAPVSAAIYAIAPVSAGTAMTGTWYDPAQPGHGLVVEALLGNRMLAEWFAFDPAGTQQSWFLGVGTVSGNTATIAAVDQPIGGRFIPNFDPTKIVNNPWGSLTLTFIDCDHGKVDFASTAAGYGSGSMNLSRLTRPVGVSCP